MTGIVKGFEVKKNRDGTKNILMLQVQVSGEDDIRNVEYMSHAGDNHIPLIDSIVTILDAGRSWKIAISSREDDNFDSSLAEGERKIFAPGGSYIKLLDDGTIELNGSADFAVSYDDLASAINNLVSSINTAIAGSITGHAHPVTTAPGTTGPGAGAAPSVTADITGSKVSEVKFP